MSRKNIAISFENVSKMYRLGLVGTGTLGQDLNRWWKMNVLHQDDPYLKIGQTNDRSTKGTSDFVYALKDIDFKVEKGDVVGIIGKNGAGKSTLLKLLSRITAPTTGQIKTRGRLASLLEVGTGFHPELTGRENIYMNGSIMGMTKAEITRKLDEIIDFAGVERYIDTPCKRYSSGMQVRLGFAVAAFLEPEILVVDEVLAVGDAEFQKKAIGKMQDVSTGSGRTVLFVSHNMSSVRRLCKSGIVLKNGMIEMTGTADECVDFYTETNVEDLCKESIITNKHRRIQYACDVEILKVSIKNDIENVSVNEPLNINVELINNTKKIKKFNIGVFINKSDGNRVGAAFSNLIELPVSSSSSTVRVSIPHHNLAKGKYSIDINLSNFDYEAFGSDLDLVNGVVSFQINSVGIIDKTSFVAWHKNMGSCAFQDTVAEFI